MPHMMLKEAGWSGLHVFVFFKPLQVLNDHGIPTPFIVQLCDEWGNPSPDQKVVVQLRSSPSALKVSLNRNRASFLYNVLK